MRYPTAEARAHAHTTRARHGSCSPPAESLQFCNNPFCSDTKLNGFVFDSARRSCVFVTVTILSILARRENVWITSAVVLRVLGDLNIFPSTEAFGQWLCSLQDGTESKT